MMRLRTALFTGILAGTFAVQLPFAMADLPAEVRQSTNADAQRPAIDAYVKGQVEIIRGTDAKAASSAREELCRQAESNPQGGVQVSASFQIAYASSVVDAIQPMMKSPDVRERLIAGVIVYRIANASKLLNMQQAVQSLLADESPAVALWGIKSAGALMPSVLNGGFAASNEKLTTGIVQAVKKHPTSGPIAQDAYKALDVTRIQPALPQAGITKAVTAINDMLAFRVQLYVKDLPPALQADRDATLILSTVIDVKDPAASVQNLIDLLGVTTQRYVAAGGAERDALQKIVENAAGALIVIFQKTKHDELVPLYKPFQRPGQLSAVTIPTTLSTAVVATQKLPAYKAIKVPPLVQAAGQ